MDYLEYLFHAGVLQEKHAGMERIVGAFKGIGAKLLGGGAAAPKQLTHTPDVGKLLYQRARYPLDSIPAGFSDNTTAALERFSYGGRPSIQRGLAPLSREERDKLQYLLEKLNLRG